MNLVYNPKLFLKLADFCHKQNLNIKTTELKQLINNLRRSFQYLKEFVLTIEQSKIVESLKVLKPVDSIFIISKYENLFSQRSLLLSKMLELVSLLVKLEEDQIADSTNPIFANIEKIYINFPFFETFLKKIYDFYSVANAIIKENYPQISNKQAEFIILTCLEYEMLSLDLDSNF